ncbi:Cathepsin_L [Hexamita inflata]|uniref:Cathepsin_L n=1 Tax=Hexamita inflata TaxID=28002 RepID=A0ABP1IKD8_9EUKA
MIIQILYSLQVNITNLTCEEGFVLYKQTFNKTYQEDEKMYFDIFCSNFLKVVELLKTDPNLPIGLVQMMDSYVDRPVQKQSGGLYQMKVVKNDYCSAVNPLPDLGTIHQSVDLREMGLMTPTKAQGLCGCCYAFQTMAIMENGVLRDKKNLNAFWQAKADASTLNLSEQYLLSNSICDSCSYCGGGNFVIETYIMVPGNKQQLTPPRNPIPTVELNDNYPYAYAANEANWKAGIYLPTKLATENQLLPIKLFNNSGLYAAWCNQAAKVTPVVKIFDDDATTFNATTIATLKSYLSRGIAVAISMLVGSGDPKTIFNNYRGGAILHNPCPTWAMDHAVTLVGYGKKGGKDVWVIKNSWGEWWGDKGFFFFEIGKNSYCSEQFAYTSIPKYFDMTETTPYDRGTLKRDLTYTLDSDPVSCTKYFTNISGIIQCYDSCPPTYSIILSGSKQCKDKCPDATPYYETGACVEKCTSGSYSVETGQTQTLYCEASCTFFVKNASNQDSHQCLSKCPDELPYSDAGLCSERCVSGNYSSDSGAFVCQGECLKFFVTNSSNSNSKQCMDSCQAGQVTSSQECLSACPAIAPFNDSTVCVGRCATGAYLAAGSNLTCISSCTGMFITNASNSNSKQCITQCPDATPYYETGACVSRCTSGAYSIVQATVNVLTCQASCALYVLNSSNQDSKQCLPSCPTTAPYSDSGLCSARCASGNYSNATGSFVCQGACPKFFATNASNSNSKQCVDSCQAGQLTSGQECLSSCPAATPYKDATSCVARCSSGSYQISGSNFNCMASCSGMYITNASNSNSQQCITVCPALTPYYETGACVAKCTSGSYSVVSGQSQTLMCQASCTFYVLNASNSNSKQCLPSCPAATPYSDAGLCSARCASGNYSNSAGSLLCQGACAKVFVTNASNSNSKQCVDSCQAGQVTSSQECLSACPAIAPFNDSTVCVGRCATGAYLAAGSNLTCISSCTGMFITNASNSNSKQCITQCPDATPYYETGACVSRCTSGAYSIVQATVNVLTCQASCALYVLNSSNQDSKQCLPSCPTTAPYSDSGLCSARCASGNYSNATGSFVCQGACPKFFATNASNSNSKQCVDSCQAGQLTSGQECLSSCPAATPYKDATSCVARCSSGSYQISGSNFNCMASCSGMYITNASNSNSQQCITVCPALTPYYETGACVAKCTSGSYSVVSGQSQTLMCQASCTFYVLTASNSNSKQCLPSCPAATPYSDAGLCSARCASGNYSNSAGSLICQGACAKFFVTNASNSNSKQCVDSCQAGQVTSSQECLSACPAIAPFNDSTACVGRCATGAYLAAGSNLTCISSCTGMFITNASNSNSKQCITQCPDATPYYETGACVSRCTSGAYSIVQATVNVLTCQASCALYVLNSSNQDSKQCLPSCPTTAPYSDSGLCSARCASGNYSNATGSFVCQGACPKFFATNASNSNSKQCVDSCQAGQLTSGQECLSSCPAATPYKDATSCVARCSSGAYQISGSNFNCMASCSGMYITNASNSNSQQCITVCPALTPYYETGACVAKCTSGSYSVVSGQSQTLMCQASCTFYVLNASNSNSKQCLPSCPAATPYSDAGLCSARCASGNYSNSAGSLLCQGACAKVFVTNASNSNSKQCVDSCQAGQVTSSQECLSACPAIAPFNDSTVCVGRCATGAYLAAGSNLTCISSCTGMFITNASNSNSKQCITQCPDATPYYETGACVSRCTSGAYSIVQATVNVLTCQASCALYVLNSSNQDSKQCLPSCPTTAPYSDSGLCSARCASGNYSNATGSFVCQGACPKFFATNASNSNSKQCVDSCQAGQLTSGQECLSSCPAATPYKDATSCVARCSSGAYQISGSNFNCVASCSGMYITNASNSNSQQCITVCPALTPYYETGACVAKCTSGSYSVVSGQSQTLMCQASCTFYVLNVSSQNAKQCLDSCPQSSVIIDGQCQFICSDQFDINCVNCSSSSHSSLSICKKQKSSSIPAIAGAVAGSILVLVIILTIIFKQKRSKKQNLIIQAKKLASPLLTKTKRVQSPNQYSQSEEKEPKIVLKKQFAPVKMELTKMTTLTPLKVPEKKKGTKKRKIVKTIANNEIF